MAIRSRSGRDQDGPGDTGPSGGGATRRDTTEEDARPALGTRAADLRFILPAPPRTAQVVDAPDTARALRLAGLSVVQALCSGTAPDLAVVPPRAVTSAIATGAASIFVTAATGHAGTRALRDAGYGVTRLLVRRGSAGPRVVVPVDGMPQRFALLQWGRPPGRLRRVRNVGVSVLAGRGVRLPQTMATLAARPASSPWPIAAAIAIGVPEEVDWLFIPGHGDELQRAVFHVFPRGAPSPEWVLKLSRVAGNQAPFAADERGLRLASEAGAKVAASAPRLLGRLDLDGLPASVETAAPGRPLNEHLAIPGSLRSKMAVIDAVADWIATVGAATARDGGTLDGELARLAALGETASTALDGVQRVPGVLAHNDLGTWNIIAAHEGSSFTVIDWEDARRPAMPLWDLLYFLTDALVALEGRPRDDSQIGAALSLLAGEHRSSPVLFQQVRTYADRLALPAESVGALATLCWQHHASSHHARSAALRATTNDGPAPPPADLGFLARLAAPWVSNPQLGVKWTAFSAWSDHSR